MTSKLRAEKAKGGLLYFDYHQITAWYPGDGVFVVDIPFGENPDNSELIKCKIGTEEWYTGLKDLKDREIYENDTIKYENKEYTIEWINGSFVGFDDLYGEQLPLVWLNLEDEKNKAEIIKN